MVFFFFQAMETILRHSQRVRITILQGPEERQSCKSLLIHHVHSTPLVLCPRPYSRLTDLCEEALLGHQLMTMFLLHRTTLQHIHYQLLTVSVKQQQIIPRENMSSDSGVCKVCSITTHSGIVQEYACTCRNLGQIQCYLALLASNAITANLSFLLLMPFCLSLQSQFWSRILVSS